MSLPDTSYVKMPNGDMEECDGQYLLDHRGNVYEYLYDLEIAVARNNYEARSVNDLPVRFEEENAIEVEVAPMEFVFESCEWYRLDA